MRNANDIAARILQEVNMHEKFCEKFGTSVDEFEREEMGTVAYTRFVLDVAHSKSTLHLRCATAPCLLGYADAGRRLAQDPKTVKGDANPYVTNFSCLTSAQVERIGPPASGLGSKSTAQTGSKR